MWDPKLWRLLNNNRYITGQQNKVVAQQRRSTEHTDVQLLFTYE